MIEFTKRLRGDQRNVGNQYRAGGDGTVPDRIEVAVRGALVYAFRIEVVARGNLAPVWARGTGLIRYRPVGRPLVKQRIFPACPRNLCGFDQEMIPV